MHSDIYECISKPAILSRFAHRASEFGLISKATKGILSEPLDRLTINERTTLFMSDLETSITSKPRALETFLDMLRESNDAFFETLISNVGMFYTDYIMYRSIIIVMLAIHKCIAPLNAITEQS